MSNEIPPHAFIPGPETTIEKEWNGAGKQRAVLEARVMSATSEAEEREAKWQFDKYLGGDYRTAEAALARQREQETQRANAAVKAKTIMADYDKPKTPDELWEVRKLEIANEKLLREQIRAEKGALLQALAEGKIGLDSTPEEVQAAMAATAEQSIVNSVRQGQMP
jgi:hypothetical protein